MKSALSALCVLSALAATPAGAVVVWDEAVDGDLTPDGTLSVVQLGHGTNTLIGQMTILWNQLPEGEWEVVLDLDPVQFALPAAAHIVAADVRTTFDDVSGNTQAFDMEWYLHDEGDLFVTCYGLKSSLSCASSPEGGPLSIGRPLAGPTTYLTYGSGHVPFDWNASHGGVVSYALDLQVAAIPEVATGGMMLAGLSVLALARRRRLGV